MIEVYALVTIRKITVAVGDRAQALAAARYPLSREDGPQAFARADDPEAADRANTMWLGSQEALDKLGLKRGAEVFEEESALVLQGRHAITGEQVRRPGSRPARHADGRPRLDAQNREYEEAVVNSYDLTFSVPKSVSVLWSQADSALRREIEHAVMVAANTMLEHITSTRLVVGGESRGHGFVAATALHVTARVAEGEQVPSPQIHVHCQLVGALDGKGNLRTPSGDALYKHSAPREAGAVARGVLAQVLERTLGFEIRARTGRGGRYFEVKHVPEGLCMLFSGRSRDVERWVREREAAVGGLLTNRERALAAAITRGVKARELTSEYIQSVWNALTVEFHWGQDKIEAMRAAPAPEHDVAALREEIRTAILEQLWQEGPSMTVGAIRSMAFEFVPTGVGFDVVNDLLEEMKRDGELVTLDWRATSEKGEGDRERDVIAHDEWRVTSREIRAREEYVHKIAVKAGQRNTGRLSEQAVARGIEVAEKSLGNGLKLLDDQVDAVKDLTSGRGWVCLTGPAGTGKARVLEAVAEAHRVDGWQVIGCAVDWTTAERLGKDISAEEPMSINELLSHARRPRRDGISIDKRTVILIDEASKVGLRHWGELAKLCARTGVRIIPVGDVMQIGAIECAGMLDVMLAHRGIVTARLKKILRHRDPNDPTKIHPWLRDYNETIHKRDPDAAANAIKILRDNDAITMHDTREKAMEGLVDTWQRRRAEHNLAVEKTMLIVHGSNEDVDHVNALAQEARQAAGELGEMGVEAPDRSYRIFENDLVMLRGDAFQPEPDRQGAPSPERVVNGTVGVVTRVDAARNRVWVSFDEPGGARQVMIDLGEMRAGIAQAGEDRAPALRLAYAWHPFPAQGANRDYVGSLWGHFSQRLQEWYSGDTRAVRWLDVHTDRESCGRDGTEDDAYERCAENLQKIHHRVASILYEEVPDVSIAVAVAEGKSVPRFGRSERGLRETSLEESMYGMGPAHAADPLEDYHHLFGPQRLAKLKAYANMLSGKLDECDDAELRVYRDKGRESLAHLDKLAALEIGRLERAQAAVEAEVKEWRRLESTGKLTRAQRRMFERDDAELKKLVARELELYEQTRHPEQWLAKHGDDFAQGIAAERKLGTRQQVRIRDEANRAIRNPPQYIVDAIGPRPSDDAPERHEWEDVTRRLVAAKVMLEDEVGAEVELDIQDDDDLASLVDALRVQRGLEPLRESPGIEQTPSEPDIGL